MDNVGPFALGDELTRIILRQAIANYFYDFFKLTCGAEPFQLLRQAAALVLGGGEGDAADGQFRDKLTEKFKIASSPLGAKLLEDEKH